MAKAALLKIIICLLIPFGAYGQVVNVEEKRLKDADGWIGNTDLEFSFTKDSEQVLELENNIQLGYQSGDHRYLFLNEIELIKDGENDVLNNGFQHVRYNYILTDFVVLEAFAQYQFNQVQQIDKRILLGLGPRFGILQKDSIKLHVGVQLMREWEKAEIYQHNIRSSNYFSAFLQISKTVSFISTTYYQPLIKDFDDYRIANESGLQFDLLENFAMELVYELLYDTRVPVGVPSTFYSINTGLSYTFIK